MDSSHDDRPPTRIEASRNEVMTLLASQAELWNKGDLEGFMAGYWQSPDLTYYSGGTLLRGWGAVLDHYRSRYQGEGREMGRLAFTMVEVRIVGTDVALAGGQWELTTTNGKSGGLFSIVLRQLHEGWLIIHDHTSSGAPAMAALPRL